MSDQSTPTNTIGRHAPFFRDVVVDVLGTLVPGTVFLTLLAVALYWPLVILVGYSAGEVLTPADPLRALLDLHAGLSIWSVLLLLMFGYVVGHFFSRQDPKIVDQRSFALISRGWPWSKREKWVCRDDSECQFPYTRLRDYLTSRDLYYLTPLVRWQAGNNSARSKSYVNTLKIRLMWDYPDRCNHILKNEAHVRLMSAAWYMSRALIWLGLLSLVLAVAAFWATNAAESPSANSWVWGLTLTFPGLVCLAASWYAKRKIEHALHYQRVREVRQVLDTAYYAYDDSPWAIRDLCPDYEGVLEPAKVEELRRAAYSEPESP